MKFQVLSDLHLEFPDPFDVLPVAENLIIAGDITTFKKLNTGQSQRFLSLIEPFKKVYYVPGNHEFYHSDLEDVYALLNCPSDKLRILHRRGENLFENMNIFGCTLWTDYMYDSEMMKRCSAYMNDNRLIRKNGLIATPQDLQAEHRLDLIALKHHLDMCRHNLEDTIVVTHHLPSYSSIDPRYKNSPINAAFASDLDYLIEEYRDVIRIWIHGHTHSSLDYKLHDTRILCNPKGYGDENPNFNPLLTIEV